MAKQRKHIDNLFRDGLSNQTEPLNGTEWDRLNKVLHPPKKRRFLWWWFVLPLGILLGGLFLWNAREGVSNETSGIVSEEFQVSRTNPSNIMGSHSSNSTSTGKMGIASQSNSTLQIPTMEYSDSPSRPLGLSRNNMDKSSTSEGTETTGSDKSNDTRVKEPSTQPVVKSNFPLSDTGLARSKWWVTLLPRNFDGFGSLKFALPVISQYFINHSFKYNTPGVTPPSPYFGLIVSGSSMKHSLSSSIPDYDRLTTQNVQNAYALDLGLEAGKSWMGLDIQTGLTYQHRSVRYGGKFTYNIYDSIPYIPISGDTTWIKWNYRDTTLSSGYENPQMSYLSIPLKIGKSFPIGVVGKSNIDVGLSGQIKILLSAKGTTLNNNLQPQNLRSSDLTGILPSAGGYVGYRREVARLTEISLRLNWNTDLGNIMREKSIRQNMTRTGISFSIRHKLY